MPVYEYFCNQCKKKFELMRPFSRCQEDADCPECRNLSHRVMSTCYGMTSSENGVAKNIDGSGNSCSSCSSGNCASCGH